jgi:hypothetical protein
LPSPWFGFAAASLMHPYLASREVSDCVVATRAENTSDAPVNSCAFLCHQNEYVFIRITAGILKDPVRLRKMHGTSTAREHATPLVKMV